MGINVFNLKPVRPIFRTSVRRRNAGEVGPTMADGSFYSNTGNSGKFNWNNLVSTLGDSISSIFGGLTGMKQAQMYQNSQMYQNRNTNTLLWIGIGVVAIIVIVIILLSRKK